MCSARLKNKNHSKKLAIHFVPLQSKSIHKIMTPTYEGKLAPAWGFGSSIKLLQFNMQKAMSCFETLPHYQDYLFGDSDNSREGDIYTHPRTPFR